MSTENIARFFQEAATNSELQSRISEIREQARKRLAEGLASLSAETKTPFTAAEFLAESDGELAELDLGAVVGGTIGDGGSAGGEGGTGGAGGIGGIDGTGGGAGGTGGTGGVGGLGELGGTGGSGGAGKGGMGGFP